MKHYRTKKKKKELHKRLWILSAIVIGVSLIQIASIGAMTPNQVAIADYIAPVHKTSETQEYSLSEHICIASEGQYCDILINLAKCESSLNKEAIGINTNGTYDAGLYQINSVHKDISLMEKLDVYASTRWTVNKIKQGQGHIWVCWNKI